VLYVLLNRNHRYLSVPVTAYYAPIASSLIFNPPVTSDFFLREAVGDAALGNCKHGKSTAAFYPLLLPQGLSEFL
jgi:hypothetical protein